MTPQLMQAIKLLQLSSLDLAAYVEGELERNPLLERTSEQEAPASESTPEAPQASGDAVAADWAGEEMQTSRGAMEEGLGTELENVFPDDGGARDALSASRADEIAGEDIDHGDAAEAGDESHRRQRQRDARQHEIAI